MKNQSTKTEVNIAIIMEKLENMHISLKTIEKETKDTNGKVAENLRKIALLEQENDVFLKREDLAKSLWGYVVSIFFVLGFSSFLFAGWFENKINNTLKESLSQDVSVAIAEELQNYEFNLVE